MVEASTCSESTQDGEEQRTDRNGHAVEDVAPDPVIPETKVDPEAQKLNSGAWIWSVVYLCFYGFMVQLKPGEPFITPYLLSTEKNFTSAQVWSFFIFLTEIIILSY